MRTFNLMLAAGCVLAFASCEKESSTLTPPLSHKSEFSALDYETYDPSVDDEYAEFKNGIIAIFEGTNPGGETDINRAIWLYESGMSALLRDTVFNDFDTVITDQREVSFTLTESEKLVDEDFISEFTTDYNQVVSFKQQHQDLDYQFTDVQFASLNNGILSLKVVNHYYQSGTRNMWSAPTVPPATYDKRGGAIFACVAGQPGGAWQHVQGQVRAVMPKTWYQGMGASNILAFGSDSRYAKGYKLYLEGGYLFGGDNSLYHPPILDPTGQYYLNGQGECVTPTEQDSYSQELADRLYDYLGKRNHWDDVLGLTVKKWNDSPSTAVWWFHGSFSNRLVPDSLMAITKADLGL